MHTCVCVCARARSSPEVTETAPPIHENMTERRLKTRHSITPGACKGGTTRARERWNRTGYDVKITDSHMGNRYSLLVSLANSLYLYRKLLRPLPSGGNSHCLLFSRFLISLTLFLPTDLSPTLAPSLTQPANEGRLGNVVHVLGDVSIDVMVDEREEWRKVLLQDTKSWRGRKAGWGNGWAKQEGT